jgi:hypothetical protein
MEGQPVTPAPQVDPGYSFRLLQPVIQRAAVQAEPLGARLRIAGKVEVGLQSRDHLAVGLVEQHDEARVEAGTGEANPAGGGMTYFGNGIYKSTDGGKTWQNVGLTGSAAIGRIVVNPDNPNEVWVAAAGSIYTSSPQRGIYHTTDGGKTWQLALASPNATTGGIDIALDPANPSRVYAALWDHHRDPAARTYGGVGSGLCSDTKLFAGTFGRGIWEVTLPTAKGG